MMMKISNKRERVLNLRIDQLNEQVCELVDELGGKDAEIKLLLDRNKSLEGQLEELTMLLESSRSGQLMANNIIDNYIRLIREYMPQELIEKCQEAAFDVGQDIVYLDDVISAIYATTAKYFCKS